MTKKPTIEFNTIIRMVSGDTCSVSVVRGIRITIGTVSFNEDELNDFKDALSAAIEESKKLNNGTK